MRTTSVCAVALAALLLTVIASPARPAQDSLANWQVDGQIETVYVMEGGPLGDRELAHPFQVRNAALRVVTPSNQQRTLRFIALHDAEDFGIDMNGATWRRAFAPCDADICEYVSGTYQYAWLLNGQRADTGRVVYDIDNPTKLKVALYRNKASSAFLPWRDLTHLVPHLAVRNKFGVGTAQVTIALVNPLTHIKCSTTRRTNGDAFVDLPLAVDNTRWSCAGGKYWNFFDTRSVEHATTQFTVMIGKRRFISGVYKAGSKADEGMLVGSDELTYHDAP